MKAVLTTIAIVGVVATTPLGASGPLGIYGIVEKVVFEPNEQAPERIQVWGAFAYVEAGKNAGDVSSVKRGYMYFKMPALAPGFTTQAKRDLVKTEWADLKAVAGTGQAVGFGEWRYIGGFGGLQPDTRGSKAPYILEEISPSRETATDLRVRPPSEAPASPATYQTNAGIVKLTEGGSHAAIVKQLKSALAQPSAGAFRLDIGRAIAGSDSKLKNVKSVVLVVRPVGCSDPAAARISGTAEGVVNGVRQSIPLKLASLEKPGVHAVSEQWPAGRWVLSLAGACGQQTAGALVPLNKAGFVRESSKFLSHPASAPEIEASLNALGGTSSR